MCQKGRGILANFCAKRDGVFWQTSKQQTKERTSMKLKYQYTYFIYPYVLQKEKYTNYLATLLNDKNCKIKVFEKGKDIDIYNYFGINTKTYMFQSFAFNKAETRELQEQTTEQKARILSQMPVLFLEYNIPENIQGKAIDENLGIYFGIQKIELVLFNTGVCFFMIKTNIEETDKFSDLLQFNYKFKTIGQEREGLANAEGIKIQTNAFNSTNELMDLILHLTGNPIRKDTLSESLTDKFFTYSYACVDTESWNDNTNEESLNNMFYKFFNILPNDYNNYVDNKINNTDLFKESKYIKFGFSRSGATLLASGIDLYNYTKLPVAFENEYLYTLLITLYQKIYIGKINLEFKNENNKKLETTKKEFITFTKTIWFREITEDEIGVKLYNRWKQTFSIDEEYQEIKSKYNIIYKTKDVEENKQLNTILLTVITIAFIINLITFILYRIWK